MEDTYSYFCVADHGNGMEDASTYFSIGDMGLSTGGICMSRVPAAGTNPEPGSRREGKLVVPTVPNAALPWVRLRREAAPTYSARLADADTRVPMDRDGDGQKTPPSPTVSVVELV